MKIADMIYHIISKKRDKKRHEVLRLRWEKAKLEKQLEQLKAEKNKKAEG